MAVGDVMVGFKHRLMCGAFAIAAALGGRAALAADDAVGELANAICAAADLKGITAVVAVFEGAEELVPTEVAEAFGIASFLGDLGRCPNRQAVADAFAFYKKGKDAAPLDAAFAMGRVAAKPGGGTASASFYDGSFAVLGTAGDPPSGQ
jgi:hypothetical protein